MLPTVMDIFRLVGDVMELPERLFDAATALHGSGPAYVALFADALIQAGVREGIPRDMARRLVVETMAGTAVDRKSTRLNSSHANISYAVFCLKKKKQKIAVV